MKRGGLTMSSGTMAQMCVYVRGSSNCACGAGREDDDEVNDRTCRLCK
jgi:hypothetical protein